MINSKDSRERLLKTISDYIACTPGSNGIGLSEVSCVLKMPFDKLIPYLENSLKYGFISVHNVDNPRILTTGEKEIEKQVKLLRSAFVTPGGDFFLLKLRDDQTIKISANKPKHL